MEITVIDYCSDYPNGRAIWINTDQIEKFYETHKDMKYIVGSGDGWFKRPKNKKFIENGLLFKMWNEEKERYVGYVKPDCHPILIEVEYASDTNIYDGSTYIQYYFSNTPLDEFIETHGNSKYVKDDEEEIKYTKFNRFEIMDI